MHRNREAKARQRVINFHEFDKQQQRILDILADKYNLSYSMLYAVSKFDDMIVPELVNGYGWHGLKYNEYELQRCLNGIRECYAHILGLKLNIWKPDYTKWWLYPIQGTSAGYFKAYPDCLQETMALIRTMWDVIRKID